MSEWFSLSGIDPALLVAAVTAIFAVCATVIALCAVWISRSLARRNAELEVRLASLQSEMHDRLRLVDGCSIGMGESITRLETRLNESIQQQQSVEQGDFSHIAHKQLSKLVGMGATAEDLVHHCGLSKAEADLLLLLNSARQKYGAAVPEH